MKKLLAPFAALILCYTLSSCGGSFECVCDTTTVYSGGNTETGTLSKTFNGPRSLASASCNNENMNYSVDDYTYTAVCQLR